MDKIKIPRTFKAYLPLIGLFLLLVAIMPRSPKFTYDYKKGSPWMHETLLSQFDFPVLKTEAQLLEEREKAGSDIVPYYRLDTKAAYSSRSALASLELGQCASVKPAVEDALDYIYSKGVLSLSPGQNIDDLTDNPSNVIYVQRNRRAVKVPVTEVFTQEDATMYLYDCLSRAYPHLNTDSLYSASSLADVVIPDLILFVKQYVALATTEQSMVLTAILAQF